MVKPDCHFIVEGPRRDYDYSQFCGDCNDAATDCAAEWLAEVFDELDVGEDVSVTMKVVAGALGDDEECCNPDHEDRVNQMAEFRASIDAIRKGAK